MADLEEVGDFTMSTISYSTDPTTEIAPSPRGWSVRLIHAILAVALFPVLATMLIVGGLGMVVVAAFRGLERWRSPAPSRPVGRYRGPIRRDAWISTPRHRIKT